MTSDAAPIGAAHAWLRRVMQHPDVVDLLVAVAVAIFALGRDHWGDNVGKAAATVFFDLALTVPLVWRRRQPLVVFGVIALVAFVSWVVDVPTTGSIAVLIALYTVGAHETRRWAVLGSVVVAEIGVAMAALRWAPADHRLTAFVLLTGTVTAAWVTGVYARTRQAYVTSVLDRATTAERERDQRGLLAAAAERARISREMHDIVAHTLSVMVALSDGAAVAAPRDPDSARDAMEQSAILGRQALSDLRRLLGGLHSPTQIDLVPTPGVAELEDLVGAVRSAGLPVDLVMTGGPTARSQGLQLSVYRVVQESLTNVLKHAPSATHAVVALHFASSYIDIEVVNDGVGDTVSQPRTDLAGRGLRGMQERAAVYGGTVEAGPISNGGWRVSCRLSVEDERIGLT